MQKSEYVENNVVVMVSRLVKIVFHKSNEIYFI